MNSFVAQRISMSKPLILVTNDDGITAKGIQVLKEQMLPLGEVLVVAPDKPQSGMGHAITVNNPLRMNQVQDSDEVKAYSCSGTPVDCVKLAIYSILKRKPDLVVSGINHGANMSINVLYSGTMSAAVEGAIEGIPSIGFSLLDHSPNADFSHTIPFINQITKNVLDHGLQGDYCLNVNFPRNEGQELKGVRVCRQGKAYWEDEFDTRKDPYGLDYYWLSGSFASFDKGEDTDVWALQNNYVSMVPVQYDMTAHHAIQQINSWDFDA